MTISRLSDSTGRLRASGVISAELHHVMAYKAATMPGRIVEEGQA